VATAVGGAGRTGTNTPHTPNVTRR
jgi:hypothetical protein